MKNIMETKDFIMTIDFTLLREQKNKLFDLLRDSDNPEAIEALEGVISLISNIQDIAVDDLGYDEKDVFDLDN